MSRIICCEWKGSHGERPAGDGSASLGTSPGSALAPSVSFWKLSSPLLCPFALCGLSFSCQLVQACCRIKKYSVLSLRLLVCVFICDLVKEPKILKFYAVESVIYGLVMICDFFCRFLCMIKGTVKSEPGIRRQEAEELLGDM